MASLLERRLVVVTGKGGAGKTTVAAALGLLAAGRGSRTLVVEVGDRRELPALFETSEERAGVERACVERVGVESDDPAREGGASGERGDATRLGERLWCASLDPDRALIDWLRRASGRVSARVLGSSATFQYFAAAAPGAKELVSLVAVSELCKPGGPYDLVVLDAPATGHALAMLAAPRTFAAIVRSGPLAAQGRGVRELLEDSGRSAFVAVAHAGEMAVAETLDLEQGLRRELDRDLDAVIVNGALPQRFTREEVAGLKRLDMELDDAGRPRSTRAASEQKLMRAAVRSAVTVHRRTRLQQSQIARLRRQRFTGGAPPDVLTVPFQFVPEIDVVALDGLARALGRRL